MTTEDDRSFLDRVWAQRENDVYPALFGGMGPGVYPIPAEVFTEVFDQSPDPRWLHVGVFASPANATRDYGVYVSTGLSNPWDAAGSQSGGAPGLSGLGIEYVFATRNEGDWAIRMLHRIIAYDLLLSYGRYPGHEPLNVGDRIPLRGPIVPGSNSALTRLLVVPPVAQPSGFQLDSGTVRFLQLIGITDDEAEFAREKGHDAFVELLRKRDAYDVTDPRRTSVAR